MKRLLSQLFCFTIVLMPLFVGAISAIAADATDNYHYTPLVEVPNLITEKDANQPNGIGGFIQNAYKITISLSITLAVIMFTYHAFMYLVSEASISSKSAAKAGMQNSVIGLILVFGAWLILYTINPELVNFNLNL